ncbi:ShlB/FhaC/HecB family hemolysin secretion/activation protein [Nostoc sp.]|uniref:ShlB/FhaC/HecB family hemolysin secretion/activation protein n=1 Tax=Nostoc sp. TaxID=1180 RepID=UPI002FF74CD6
MGSAVQAVPSSSNFLSAQRTQIQRSLPSGWTMRLPEKLLLTKNSPVKNIQVLTSDSSSSLSVNFFTCETPAASCYLGSLSVHSRTSDVAQQALQKHQMAAPITLAANVKGYLLEGPRQNPPYPFSSVMWEQDNLIYSIRFPAQERQNILYMAKSMVNGTPILAMTGLAQATETLAQGSEPTANNRKTTQLQTTNLSQIPNSIIPITPEQGIPTLPQQREPLHQPTTTPTKTENIPETSDRFLVKKYEFVGEYKAFTQEQLEKATAPFTGKEITFVKLLDAEQAVRVLYNQGCNSFDDKPCYVNSDVAIPAGQNINQQGGVVKIKIVEGSIEEIKVTGTRRLRDYVRSRLALATGKPFNQKRLLAALQILEQDPLIDKISAAIVAGARPENSLLEVRVTEADPFKVELFTDNSRAPSVGSIRRGIRLNHNNLFGLGDGLSASYTNTDGSNAFDASYTVPLNPHNGTLRVAGGMTSTNVVEPPFDRLDILGDSYFVELSYRQPLLLTPTQEFALGLTASRQQSKTSLLGINFPLSPGADDNGETRISVLRFFQDWTKRSPNDVIALRSQFSLGIDAFNASINEQSPDSRFFTWRGQAQYVRRLAQDTLLFLHSDLQLASDSLVPLEQFGLGGLQSVRGYRQDALLTDNGFFASAEVRLPVFRVKKVDGILQLIPFIDFGIGWNNSSFSESDTNQLLGTGLGLQWQMGNKFNARIDWGIPLIDVNSRNRTWQENGIYFLLNYTPF